jgi:hypothetical protein
VLDSRIELTYFFLPAGQGTLKNMEEKIDQPSCRLCGALIPDGVETCPDCGRSYVPSARPVKQSARNGQVQMVLAAVEKPRSATPAEKTKSAVPPLRPQAFLSHLSEPRLERTIGIAVLPIIVIVLATFVIPWLSSEFSLDTPKPAHLTMLDGESAPVPEEVAPIVDRTASEEHVEASAENVATATEHVAPQPAVPGENGGTAKDWYHDAEFTVPVPRLNSEGPTHPSKGKHRKKQPGHFDRATAEEHAEASSESVAPASQNVAPATQNVSPPQAVHGENAGAAKDWYHDAEFTVPAPGLISEGTHPSKSKHGKKQPGRFAQAPAKRPSL